MPFPIVLPNSSPNGSMRRATSTCWRSPSANGDTIKFGTLIQEARLHFINVIEEARSAGLDTIDMQNMLAAHNIDLDDTIRPDLRERLDELLRAHANPR